MPFHVVRGPEDDAIPVVVLYGSETNPSFRRADGPAFVFVGVPADARVAPCPRFGGLELSCSLIAHVGPEALLSFADEPDDVDFFRVPRNEAVQKICFVRPPRSPH